MKERKYTFQTARAPGADRSYTKKESELKPNEINLLLGNFIKEFNDQPEIVKMMFMQRLSQLLQERQMEKLENDLSKGTTGDNSPIESEDTFPDKNQELESVHVDSGLSSEGEEPEIQ